MDVSFIEKKQTKTKYTADINLKNFIAYERTRSKHT